MDNSIAVRDTSLQGFLQGYENKREIAKVLIQSHFLPSAYTTPEQVIAVMLTAHELRIPTMEALRSINVIQGKPTVSPQLMLALARRSGELADIRFDHNPDHVACTVTRKGQSAFTTRFGASEAKAMGLDSKDNYRKQAHTMYQWRALAANLRVTFGDVITGLYTPEELGADIQVTEEGEQVVVSHEVKESQIPVIESHEPERVEVSGASFPTFDPQKETIGFGKNQGLTWIECPSDYLRWLATNANKPDVKQKAIATLGVLNAVKTQSDEAHAGQPSAIDEMFPETKQ